MLETLKTKTEFRLVFKNGLYITKRKECLGILYYKQNNLKIGIIVKRKAGNAVLRNKARRQIKAIFYEGLKQNAWLGHFVLSVTREFINLNYIEKQKYVQRAIETTLAK